LKEEKTMRRFVYAIVLAGGIALGAVPVADAAGVVTRASISNAYPAQYSTVTAYGRILVNGHGKAGVPMTATWHYKTTTSFCTGVSDGTGLASCSRRISRATAGFFVSVVVTFRYAGAPAAYTGFTPS
jgi:hypothetical protein